MTTYSLYLESGPKRRKTMVHVPELLGCVAVGPTTGDALAATPEAIRAFLRFLRRNGHIDASGNMIDPDAPFDTVVVEHVTEGAWLGNGSPYVIFGPDFEPVEERELKVLLARFGCLCDELAAWASTRAAAQLDEAPPEHGRTARAILFHVLGSVGGYLSAALGSAPGFSSLVSAAERGEIGLPEAMRRVAVMSAARVGAASPGERAAVRTRPKDQRTLRKALRRMLEHAWEHLAELSRRPGGPAV